MSLEIVRAVARDHPQLLQANLGSTCHQYTLLVIAKLRAAGHTASLVCKTRGEGQYVPPGFQPRQVTGLDGKTYTCTGVSHDAIWCDGKQFDTLGSANEHEQPIFRKSTDPFWSFDSADGPQITATAIWNEISSVHWRKNNPPLVDDLQPNPSPSPAPAPAPLPQPVVKPTLPDRGEMIEAGEWLDQFYSAPEGLQRPQGLSKNGRPDWEGIGVWLFDLYLQARVAGKTRDEARAAVVAAIRQTDEWKSKHP